MFNPIIAANNIKDEFTGYIDTLFHIADSDYAEQFSEALREEGVVSKGPYLDVDDSYKGSLSLEQLIIEGVASPLFRELEGDLLDKDKEIKIERKLYCHQEKALRKANLGENLVVTTGTGSGKTECFVIPILNYLLCEAEKRTLQPGVRAILIYPMNALANDQMKRFRKILGKYPEITFGVYNSGTKQTEQEGINEYGKIYKDKDGNALMPLPNEIVSRDRMQITPPHILITNYAMLEYMLLRPKDDLVFSGAQLRFLVLDEAHIYRGTTGMETSLLLKRLKARISNPENVVHILTSATLGDKDADQDILKFASALCDANFKAENIIRAESLIPSYDKAPKEISLDLFAELADPKISMREIADKYQIDFPNGKKNEEFLYDLCVESDIYRDLRNIIKSPMTVTDIVMRLQEKYEIKEQDVVNIICVAAQASKNGAALIRARYHMFAKALEGAYITVGQHKKIMLTRKKKCLTDSTERKVFEAAVCDDCGRMAVVGRVIDGFLEFSSNIRDEDCDYFFICDSNDPDLDIEEDGNEEENISSIEKEDYLLCSKCGAIFHESLRDNPACECGRSNYIKVKRARKTLNRNEGKCPSCSRGVFKRFYLGYDAATAVLATSLFEELPESEMKIVDSIDEPKEKKNLFRSSKRSSHPVIVRKKRQFLCFSDNRGEAAFFASYMSESYKEFLRRRGIWHIVEMHRDDMAARPWEISHFVDELTAYFDASRTFAKPEDTGAENLTPVSRKNAWIAILNEMVNARRSTSLSALGIINFNYKGNTEDIMDEVAEAYKQSPKDIKALFDLLVMDVVYHGAIEGKCDLTDEEREYIFFSAKPRRIKKCKDVDKDRKKAYLAGWAATYRKNGNLQRNGRLGRVMKVLGLDENEANDLLKQYWDGVLNASGDLPTAGNEEYYLSTEQFTIGAGAESIPFYVCDVCGKTSMINCRGMCTTLKCGGRLKPVSYESIQERNHYAKLYKSSLMQPLHIKEHTAQLGREEQQRYQEMFVKKELNALSCSTTFEMGVDVGDLETVYLRDVPPSPANYVQRAGRAGRGLNKAAFSLTYAKLGSHDFTFYNHPMDLITGKIGVPLFTVENEKVISRHIYAVALSDFFAKNEDVYNSNNADIFLNGDGWERFCAYLDSKPENLKSILKASIPDSMHKTMGIDDFSWVERLTGASGVLRIAVEEFRSTVDYYENERNRYLKEGNSIEAGKAEYKLKSFRRSAEDKNGTVDLIEFFVRNNILPKYGFPVDTVELHQNINNDKAGKLQMVRDLQIAIAEYAPNAQVVADGKLYTSRYIRKLPQKTGQSWETVYIAQCGNPSCKSWNHSSVKPESPGKECVSCNNMIGETRWMQAIEPRRGFVAEDKPKAVPMRKPDRTYRSEDFYIGDPQRQTTQKYGFIVENGEKFQMETSVNDSLMVVCNDDFYVCPRCGYAESVSENKEKGKFNSHKSILEKKHTSPWGKLCSARMEKNKLCHVFKTDVVHLVFATDQAGRQDVMLSVMYALLEAMSSELDIERNDIKGCLHKISYCGGLVYSIVLYDAVAGGAGHVRRIVTEDGSVFQKVVSRAIAITKGCNCDPSCYNCLRNYYNQKIHDLLNRRYAYEFLEQYCGQLTLENFE